jgi:hypothetical protein
MRRPPNLPTDYFDAMKRHWEDAELLWNQKPQRFANADHLYGLVAECGLKALMTKLVLNFFDNIQQMPSDPSDRKHANLIWGRYMHYSQGSAAARYALPPNTDPFAQWEIHDRYANHVHFAHARVLGHRNAALMVKTLVDQAVSQQVLP